MLGVTFVLVLVTSLLSVFMMTVVRVSGIAPLSENKK
jgi:hypothetical protein